MRSHSVSNASEKPTNPTNAPIAIPMPQSVSNVLRRRRHRFFQTNNVSDNGEVLKSESAMLPLRIEALGCKCIGAAIAMSNEFWGHCKFYANCETTFLHRL